MWIGAQFTNLDEILVRLEQRIMERINAMAIDVTKITASAQRAEAGIESVLAALAATKTQLDGVSKELAAAVAANDPAAITAAQQQLDALAAGLDAESDKIAAATQAPASPAPA